MIGPLRCHAGAVMRAGPTAERWLRSGLKQLVKEGNALTAAPDGVQ